MKKTILILTIFVLIASSAFAFKWPWSKDKDEKKLSVTGSTTVLPIAQKTAEIYMNKHSDINISIRGGGSGVGIAALIDGTAEIANASRPIKDKEIKAAKEKGANPYTNIVARDGIAVVVHPSNSIDKISIAQIKGIYTGEINNWNQLGGESKEIVVVSRDNSSGTYAVFNKLALGDSKVRGDAVTVASNNAAAQTVSQTPGAIGYIGLGYLSERVKALKVNGVKPTNKTVNSGDYTLARPLFMYTNGKPEGLAKQYLDFIMSSEGQEIVKELGFVPVN
ncbi:MAG: phosphate ABC transporter substrate-binding protein [Candidatus Cloacimonetes bacterium]|nr:phosphate ABC transporter substrate-binding protein [Candidatus Cloacimonadota bacterium]MBS3767336.1 phosphate ABC transporter substrate-binding protein [Candidatus Cloacimonadota bacterium]